MSEDHSSHREQDFESAYGGTPPWEIGRAQRAFVELAEAGVIEGAVLDVGCGTGENALMLAERGYDVVGIDTTRTAIERARVKARERGLDADFLVHDAYALSSLSKQFDTIIDSGLFHVLVRGDPERYAASLRTALRSGGHLFVLGFDERDSGQGPGISRADIHEAFTDGWRVESIDESIFETVGVDDHKRRAWLATIRAADETT